MWPRFSSINRLQRKLLLLILAIVVVPMLVAAVLASEWVSSSFEERLERWITDSAHVGQIWLQAYQNDAVILGKVLADDPGLIARLDQRDTGSLAEPVARIARELGIHFLQVYDTQQRMLYSSAPVALNARWERGQTEAVVRAVERSKSVLTAVGITAIPREGVPRYYLVLGSVLDRDFLSELSQLTGLRTRLYYRDGNNYIDASSFGGKTQSLRNVPKAVLKRLQRDKQPFYSPVAEDGRFRGQYTPILDSSGRIEAILFNGLERRGIEEVLTNQVALFVLISLLGIAIGGLVGALVSRMVLRPIDQLRTGVMRLAGQDFNAAVPIESDDELGDLAKAFNAMAVRLREARDEQASRFQRDKLAALGELSAALAHEIRNPLGVINTAAALMDKAQDDANKRAELLRMMREESHRVSQLIQDFLQLSRHRPPQLAIIDPVAPLEKAVGNALAGTGSVEVVRQFTHGDSRVRADAGLLQQAWGAIVGNALEAMGANGGRLRLSSSVVDGELFLAVEDSGPGIPADALARVFEPFFTTKEGGTGLGLAIAHTLVEANHAKLEAQSPRTGGARFVMRYAVHSGSAT